MNTMQWPYDEVLLDLQLDKGKVAVKAPWLEATVSADIIAAHELKTLCSLFKEQTLSGRDLPLVNRFFAHFEAYPFCYTLPEQKGAAASDYHTLVDNRLSGDMREVLRTFADDGLAFDLDFGPSDLDALLSLLPRNAFEWDADAALAFASIGDAIHPESFFSVARRYHLLEILNSDNGNQSFQQMQSMNDASFKTAICKVLRNNHYVTERCQRALAPALNKAQSARAQVEAFKKEEQGHDKLLERAINCLDEQPCNIEVSLTARALMSLLEYAAHRNFLAFSMAVDIFERSNYEEVDPIAKLLQSRGFDKAAGYINAHMKINDHGNHENVAKNFLFAMAPCSKDYALEAIRLVEMLSIVMCSMSRG